MWSAAGRSDSRSGSPPPVRVTSRLSRSSGRCPAAPARGEQPTTRPGVRTACRPGLRRVPFVGPSSVRRPFPGDDRARPRRPGSPVRRPGESATERNGAGACGTRPERRRACGRGILALHVPALRRETWHVPTADRTDAAVATDADATTDGVGSHPGEGRPAARSTWRRPGDGQAIRRRTPAFSSAANGIT
jgi:hypothetical protein